MSHVSDVMKAKPYLLPYFNDVQYAGYRFATDPKYNDPVFRIEQAKRYYLSSLRSPQKPNGLESYWILVYCKSEINELMEKCTQEQNAKRSLVNRSFDAFSRALYDLGQMINKKTSGFEGLFPLSGKILIVLFTSYLLKKMNPENNKTL